METSQQWIKLTTLILMIYSLGYLYPLVDSQSPITNFNWTCNDSSIEINLSTEKGFFGIIYANNYRQKSNCFVIGTGNKLTKIYFDRLSSPGQCGQERKDHGISIGVWVRISPTLELMYDKLHLVKCSERNVFNTENGPVITNLSLYTESNKKVDFVVEGERYYLRNEITNPNNKYYSYVGACIGYSEFFTEDFQSLTDNKGCSVNVNIMESFKSNSPNQSDAFVVSMFRFPNKKRLFIQCNVYISPRKLTESLCVANQVDFSSEANLTSTMTVYVQDPGTKNNDYCEYNTWLLGLCIVFGILFLIMLIVNIFMCTAMSCTCTKKVLMEEELEDYDPYKMGWTPASSTYSNRYGSAREPFSHTSTLESRAPSTSSEQYAVVNSPPSRFSAPSTKERNR